MITPNAGQKAEKPSSEIAGEYKMIQPLWVGGEQQFLIKLSVPLPRDPAVALGR